MKNFHPQQKIKRFLCLATSTLIILLLSIIPVRLTIAHYQAPHPQAILTLGGGIGREKFTAKFAQLYPSLEIWVSSGAPPKTASAVFRDAGISNKRVHLDYRATDTVTNFTTLVTDFKQQKIKHLYLITSAFHMGRAKAIATIVLGSQGIAFTPVSIPSSKTKEPLIRILLDIGRSLFWIVTGHTGSSLKSIAS
ncbi:MAG: YdcF family protein [Symploca sp. SIO3C6]|nr:YdcF family protein [Symploca sp. SIO3C6]